MSNNWLDATLETIGGGAAVNQFNHQLKEAFKNVQDANTDATAERTVTLKVKIKPNPQRTEAVVEYQATTKLAPHSSGVDALAFNQTGKGYVRDAEQLPLLDGEVFDPVTGEIFDEEGSN